MHIGLQAPVELGAGLGLGLGPDLITLNCAMLVHNIHNNWLFFAIYIPFAVVSECFAHSG